MPASLFNLAKKWQFGKIAYHAYFRPKSFLKECERRGISNMAWDAYTRKQMEKQAYNLPTTSSSERILDIYFLTGKKFWDQTCFCAYSFAQHSPFSIRPIIYDDGSLNIHHCQAIKRIFPHAKILLKPELDACIETNLPESKFPYLRERRQNYPNIRKLTDVHVGSRGWKLVLDSDMLFFQTPNFLIDWLNYPQQPCHMVDVETAYGYSEQLMTELAGAAISERLNVGICGLKSEDIDWEQLEYWCKTLIEREQTHYYQEQALIAMLMAGKPCAVAPAKDYIVMPSKEEVIHPKAVLHHYVANSKPWYFRYGWKHILQNTQLKSMEKTA
ncbi:hypothetical protein [Fortiea contorta]|uniref:hypothetical protein n=1 Tax=Fortiea contorta TaxID=1892405 RepID=UPI0003708ECF|nr:hypothetical protein [Fortiea contorta]